MQELRPKVMRMRKEKCRTEGTGRLSTAGGGECHRRSAGLPDGYCLGREGGDYFLEAGIASQ